MTIKASLHGPNRRRNRPGDVTVAADLSQSRDERTAAAASSSESQPSNEIRFHVRSLDDLLADYSSSSCSHSARKAVAGLGNACLFTSNGEAGRELLRRHEALTAGSDEPILIHFHDIPIFVLRAVPLPSVVGQKEEEETEEEVAEDDLLYLSKVHCHNHKVCEDTIMKVECCSRPSVSTDYDLLSAVGIEVYLRKTFTQEEVSDDGKHTIKAKDICRQLMNETSRSVLTVNESTIITAEGKDLVCRVAEVRIKKSDDDPSPMSSADATMDEPYRGRVFMHTEFYVSASDTTSLTIEGGRTLPEGDLPDDIVHITTSDMEWFPVRRVLLAPCIKLTKYVQAGRGKYKDIPMLSQAERSKDAPVNDGCPHCKVPIDCCTFDRVLLFITSMLFPEEQKFALDLAETNALADAADALGLQPLSDLCASQVSSFDSRVRKDRYIRLSEVISRNDEHGELLILLDGMVLDITRWLDEHPGGPSIIPTQALNIDCTVFFEMYHVSRQAFLYLKSFYIGELAPEDLIKLQSSADGVEASEGFLQSLRSFTDEWRVRISEKEDERVHKSL